MTLRLCVEDQIFNTDESINGFCRRLQQIMDEHRFSSKLDENRIHRDDVRKIALVRCKDICDEIGRVPGMSRDFISRKIVSELYDLCYAVLAMNVFRRSEGSMNVSERLAYEIAIMHRDTRYLADFFKNLKYVGRRIPREGQVERLILAYCDYLWNIRLFLEDEFKRDLLHGLDGFPRDLDSMDEDYYESVAAAIDSSFDTGVVVSSHARYYVRKKTPFYSGKKRCYEIMLQQAGLYTTKFNRFTVFSKTDIPTVNSIRIQYRDLPIRIFGIQGTVSVIDQWSVSIDPWCLNW